MKLYSICGGDLNTTNGKVLSALHTSAHTPMYRSVLQKSMIPFLLLLHNSQLTP